MYAYHEGLLEFHDVVHYLNNISLGFRWQIFEGTTNVPTDIYTYIYKSKNREKWVKLKKQLL